MTNPLICDYLVYDVFTDAPFGGNPLAVMPDASALPEEVLQTIAREFNFSESVFVYPPQDVANTARVRIFTPTQEIPFAGHPTIGTAIALRDLGRGDDQVLELGVGPISCRVGPNGARFVTRTPLEILAEPRAQLIAAGLGLPERAIVTERHGPVMASVGLPFVLCELADPDSLEAAGPVADGFRAGAAAHPSKLGFAIFAYCRHGRDVRARMFAPLDNIPEDPATGSAAAALGAFLAQMDGADLELDILQGSEMGRPSRIGVSVSRDGAATAVTISGQAVRVMAGQIHLPG